MHINPSVSMANEVALNIVEKSLNKKHQRTIRRMEAELREYLTDFFSEYKDFNINDWKIRIGARYYVDVSLKNKGELLENKKMLEG